MLGLDALYSGYHRLYHREIGIGCKSLRTYSNLNLKIAAAPLGYIIFKPIGHLSLFYVPFGQEIFKSPSFAMHLARPIRHLEEAVKFYDWATHCPLHALAFFLHTQS